MFRKCGVADIQVQFDTGIGADIIDIVRADCHPFTIAYRHLPVAHCGCIRTVVCHCAGASRTTSARRSSPLSSDLPAAITRIATPRLMALSICRRMKPLGKNNCRGSSLLFLRNAGSHMGGGYLVLTTHQSLRRIRTSLRSSAGEIKCRGCNSRGVIPIFMGSHTRISSRVRRALWRSHLRQIRQSRARPAYRHIVVPVADIDAAHRA